MGVLLMNIEFLELVGMNTPILTTEEMFSINFKLILTVHAPGDLNTTFKATLFYLTHFPNKGKNIHSIPFQCCYPSHQG